MILDPPFCTERLANIIQLALLANVRGAGPVISEMAG